MCTAGCPAARLPPALPSQTEQKSYMRAPPAAPPPGYHLHYLSDDKQRGGHLLDVVLSRGTLYIQPVSSSHLAWQYSWGAAHRRAGLWAGAPLAGRAQRALGGMGA